MEPFGGCAYRESNLTLGGKDRKCVAIDGIKKRTGPPTHVVFYFDGVCFLPNSSTLVFVFVVTPLLMNDVAVSV